MRFSSPALAALLALPMTQALFLDTTPLLAFSSHVFAALDSAAHAHLSNSGPVADPRALAKSLTRDAKALCSLDGIAIVEMQDLSHNTLQSLSSTHPLRARALAAPSKLALRHVAEAQGSPAQEIARAVDRACKQQQNVVRLTSSKDQSEDVLGEFVAAYPQHLVVLTSVEQPLAPSKRANALASAPDGLFHRYQFLSTGLLTAVLVVVFLLLPIAFGSIMLLSGIESPVPKRPMDAGKKSN